MAPSRRSPGTSPTTSSRCPCRSASRPAPWKSSLTRWPGWHSTSRGARHMDLRPDSEQKGILDAVSTLLRRTAGPERARAAGGAGDPDALARLAEAGFCDIARSGKRADQLTALLVVEQAARFLVPAPVGARALAAAYAGLKDPPLMIALASGDGSLARYGADADVVLMLQ